MRFKSGFRRSFSATIVISVVLVLFACESTPPPVSDTSSQPQAVSSQSGMPLNGVPQDRVPELVASPKTPAVVETKPPLPVEVPEKPVFVSGLRSPAVVEPLPIAEEPENPFAENDALPATPPEKAVTFVDIPLPAAPVLPEEPKAVPAPVVKAADKAADKAAERPSVSTPLIPPAVSAKTPVAKPAKKELNAKPQAEPKKETPAVVKEQVVMPAKSLPDLPSRVMPAAEEEKVDFSRAVRVMAGQLLEIPYRGAGWIFLGEKSAKKGLPYDSRRLDK
ncbi:MAG: hypothetical protein WCT14_17285, partial [Treponemataceae bacterium]